MIKNTLFFLIVLCITLAVIEFGSRLILPISPGVKKIDLEGNEIDIGWNTPDVTYIQKSAEWNLPSTNDEYGNRVVPARVEQMGRVLFLGDSFTYGLGVSDEDTIPNVVCMTAKVDCVNLGVPGSGLVLQRDKIADYLQRSEGESVRTVYHLVMASTEQNYSGNDITDTNLELKSEEDQNNTGLPDPMMLKVARWSSKNSNFVRIMRFYFGSWLRGVLFENIDARLPEADIKNFAEVLKEIEDTIQALGIEYVPLLVSPYSEVSGNTYVNTVNQIQEFAGITMKRPEYTEVNAASLFYPLDGHFNAEGARFYAEFIVETYFQDSANQ